MPLSRFLLKQQLVSSKPVNEEIKVNGQRLETIPRFKYPTSVVSDEGSKGLQDSTDDSSTDRVETSFE